MLLFRTRKQPLPPWKDDAARTISAVNTLWLENGRLHGGGCLDLPPISITSAPGWDKADNALVLGAGGASQAIVHAL